MEKGYLQLQRLENNQSRTLFRDKCCILRLWNQQPPVATAGKGSTGCWWHLAWTVQVEVLRHVPPQAFYPHHWHQEGTQCPQLSFPQIPILSFVQLSSLLLQRALNPVLISLCPSLMFEKPWRPSSPLITRTPVPEKPCTFFVLSFSPPLPTHQTSLLRHNKIPCTLNLSQQFPSSCSSGSLTFPWGQHIPFVPLKGGCFFSHIG